MAEFEKQADKAAANSKASKEQKAKETKEEKEKREKYEKHMKKAEELIAAKNHKEAVTALGQARLYATEQNQKTVDEKIEEQKRAMNQAVRPYGAGRATARATGPPTRGGTEAYGTTTDRTDASTATPAVCTTAGTAADAGTATGVSPAGTTADAAATAVSVSATGNLPPGSTRRTTSALRGGNAPLLRRTANRVPEPDISAAG